MLSPEKPETFPYGIKWLIRHYALKSIDDEEFKTKLETLLSDYPMSTESASACISKYFLDQEKYGPLSVDDLKYIADLIREVDHSLGARLQSWIAETYSE